MYSADNITAHLTLSEKSLWQGCIRQHIQDLFLPTNTKRNQKLRQEAHNFLFVDNDVYPVVCSYAGYDPDSLRKKILKLHKDKSEKKESLIRRVHKDYAA